MTPTSTPTNTPTTTPTATRTNTPTNTPTRTPTSPPVPGAYFSVAPTDASVFDKVATVTVNGVPAHGAWYWERSSQTAPISGRV